MNGLRDFRSELPFGDEVLRDLHRDVMKRIERDASRPSLLAIAFRFALAAAAVLLVTRIVEPPLIRAPQQPNRVAVAASPAPLPQTATETRRVANPPTRTHKRHRMPATVTAGTAPVRIEIHTSNPDIRILWINQPNSSEPSGETR